MTSNWSTNKLGYNKPRLQWIIMASPELLLYPSLTVITYFTSGKWNIYKFCIRNFYYIKYLVIRLIRNLGLVMNHVKDNKTSLDALVILFVKLCNCLHYQLQSNLCTTSTLGTRRWWSLFRGHLCNKSSNWDLKMMVVIDRWSLFRGGR